MPGFIQSQNGHLTVKDRPINWLVPKVYIYLYSWGQLSNINKIPRIAHTVFKSHSAFTFPLQFGRYIIGPHTNRSDVSSAPEFKKLREPTKTAASKCLAHCSNACFSLVWTTWMWLRWSLFIVCQVDLRR